MRCTTTLLHLYTTSNMYLTRPLTGNSSTRDLQPRWTQHAVGTVQPVAWSCLI